MLVALLEERRKIACLSYCEDALRRTCNPCQHTCKYSEHQRNGHNRTCPRDVEMSEVVVESDQERLSEVDVLCRDDKSKCECAEYEDCYSGE